jgi:hypothetical protein
MLTLSDLPTLLRTPSFVTVHGIGQGGGELVARKLASIFGIGDDRLTAYGSGLSTVVKKVLHRRVHGHVLCTAGPRDAPVLLMSALMLRRADVYLQVPYHRSLTWQDPVHLIAVGTYLILLMVLARKIFVNSTATGQSILLRRRMIVLPVARHELDAARDLNSMDKVLPTDMPRTFNVVCRLNRERGRGSRDLEGLSRFVREVADWNQRGGLPTIVEHYGECEPTIKTMLLEQAPDAIRFHGHVSDWICRNSGPLVLFSRYEGFGLAAFEAAGAGRPVFVNEAFPPELLAAVPRIRRFRSATGTASILSQLDVYR